MLKLTQQGWEKAIASVDQQDRCLEQSLRCCSFRGGSAQAVQAAIVEFQNPDGGFGHALEPHSTYLIRCKGFVTFVTLLPQMVTLGSPYYTYLRSRLLWTNVFWPIREDLIPR